MRVIREVIHLAHCKSFRMGASTLVGGPPAAGCEMRIGGYDIEVDSEISGDE